MLSGDAPDRIKSSCIDKLVTTNKYSIVLPLPFVDTQQIRSVPGVAEVTWLTWFGGYYQEPKNFVFALPVAAAYPSVRAGCDAIMVGAMAMPLTLSRKSLAST